MSQPFVGEIRMFGGNFAPVGWAFCDGQLMPISENEVLFQLIGTTYGGDGESTFALPDLRGRVPIHAGQGFILAETGGVEAVTLTTQQIPTHSHALLASTGLANSTTPQNTLLAQADVDMYVLDSANQAMHAQSITSIGGSQPHDNMGPYLAVSFIISLYGIFPSPT